MGLGISFRAPLFAVWFLLLPQLTLAQGTWTGAGPEGGEVRSIVTAATTPETVYAGTRGGVFKRTSAETRWALASAGLGDFDIRKLVVDPANPAILFAGTASGIWKTTNGGASWNAASSGLPGGVVSALAFDATPNVVYAGTRDGVYKTVDGGARWQSANTGIPGRVVSSLVADPFLPGIVYVAADNLVFKTTDSGATWTLVFVGLLLAPGDGIDALAIDPHPQRPGILLAASRYTSFSGSFSFVRTAIFRSTDHGANWSRIQFSAANGDPTRLFVFAFDPANAGQVYAGTDFGVARGSDTGGSWQNTLGFRSEVRDLTVSRETPWILWAGSPSRGAIRADYGLYPFIELATMSGGLIAHSIGAVALDAANPDLAYTVTTVPSQGNLQPVPTAFRSVNGGQSWLPMTLGTAWLLATAVAADPTTPETVYAGMTDVLFGAGAIFKSVDAGVTWSSISRNAYMTGVRAVVPDPRQSGTLYALTSTILKTANGGGSWFPVPLPSGTVQALAIAPGDSNTVYATTGVALFKSSNGAASWQTSSMPAGVSNIRALAVDPANRTTLFLGTEDGVFRSVDGGDTWAARNAGLSSTDVTALMIEPLAPATMYAGTAHGGVFRTADGGRTWIPFNDGIATKDIAVLTVSRAYQPRLYAGTQGSGVYARTRPVTSLGSMTRSTPVVFRPGTAQWAVAGSSGALAGSALFGDPALGDLPVPGDYDSDGARDIAIYRPGTSDWIVIRSSDGSIVSKRLGEPGRGDTPAPADYDGDGRTDLAVYRTSTRELIILHSSTELPIAYPFGYVATATLALADYDGDGRVDPAWAFGTSRGLLWRIWLSRTNSPQELFYGNHFVGDVPQPADYDGDGQADVAVYRQTTGQWFVYGSTAGQLAPIQFGSPVLDDIPVAGDYDGDGRADVAVYRKSTGEWFWFGSTSGFSGPVTTGSAAPGDVPLTTAVR